MKKINFILLFVIYLTSCSPQIITTPTLTPPTETLTPIPTSTTTLTPTIAFTPTATLEPSQLKYRIDDGVSNEDIQIIQDGIDVARTYIRDFLGGDIPVEQQELVIVEIVSTGLGNQSPGGGGSCCTALDEAGAHLFFDTKHPEWISTGIAIRSWSDKADFMAIAAHEYTHAWQNSLGCLDINNQPLGDWMNEGIAAYISYNAMINYGDMLPEKVKAFQIALAEYTGEISIPLEALSKTGSPVWPGNIGYLAIEQLLKITDSNLISLRFICEQVGGGVPIDKAFEDTFGISIKDFYIEFQQYIDSIYVPTPQPSLSTGISGKIIWDSSYPNDGFDKYMLVFCPTKGGDCIGGILIKTDGTFYVSALSGDYFVSLNVKDGNQQILGWYKITGMVKSNNCAGRVQVIDGRITEIEFKVNAPRVACN